MKCTEKNNIIEALERSKNLVYGFKISGVGSPDERMYAYSLAEIAPFLINALEDILSVVPSNKK